MAHRQRDEKWRNKIGLVMNVVVECTWILIFIHLVGLLLNMNHNNYEKYLKWKFLHAPILSSQ